MEPTLTVLITDDEPNNLIILRSMLRRHLPQITTVLEAGSVPEALEIVHAHHPDILLLDVQIHGQNGFELLQQMPDYPHEVIFVTAHDEYAHKAFRFEAADFLLKPVMANELERAISKAIFKLKHRSENPPKPLANHADTDKANGHKHNITVATADGFFILPLHDIIYCEASSNYTVFHLAGKPRLVSSQTLGHYEDLLKHNRFFRIHRSVLVNLDHVIGYKKGEGGMAVMTNMDELEISRTHKTAFLDIFKG